MALYLVTRPKGAEHLKNPAGIHAALVDAASAAAAIAAANALAPRLNAPFAGYDATQVAATAGFRRGNAVISSAWLAAFGVMTIADYAMARIAGIPQWLDVVAIVAAFVAAVWFTAWYPARMRRKST